MLVGWITINFLLAQGDDSYLRVTIEGLSLLDWQINWTKNNFVIHVSVTQWMILPGINFEAQI